MYFSIFSSLLWSTQQYNVCIQCDVANEMEVDFFFLEFSCFLCEPTDIDTYISVSIVFSKSSLYIRKLSVHIPLKSSCKDF